MVSRALPPGGSGGLGPPGISVNYPCLASAAAVPCPRALPPIFFRPNFFVGIFSSDFFFVRRRSVVLPSVVRPSVVRPSVRGAIFDRGAIFNVDPLLVVNCERAVLDVRPLGLLESKC